MNKRSFLMVSLFISIILFTGVAAGVLFRFSLPQPELIYVGRVVDFPPSETPYKIPNQFIYLVNTGIEFFAVASQDTHPQGCRVNWYASEQKFIDPCIGSQYDLTGIYIQGPAPRNLDQHRVVIENGQIWVESWLTIRGEKSH